MRPEPIIVKLGPDGEKQLKKYLQDNLFALRDGLRVLHEDRIPRWRRIYDAEPAEKVRDFPFFRASNLVVPLAAIHTDTLHARIMSAIFKTRPLWPFRALGSHKGEAEVYRAALEEAFDFLGLDPDNYDLYRVYNEAVLDMIKLGTMAMKFPWEYIYNDVPVAGDGLSTKLEFMRDVKKDGPRPEKIMLEDLWMPVQAKTFDGAHFKAHRLRMQKWELEDRRFRQIYDAKKVDSILGRPDRTSPLGTQQQQEASAGMHTSASYGYAEWDIFECWTRYVLPNGKNVRLICTYHLTTDTLLRAVFNFYPNQLDAIIVAKMFYRDGMSYGMGFPEVLSSLQEELSEIHNGRRDNVTIANTKVWRADPDSKIHEGYQIYPSAVLPAAAGELEPLDHGNVAAQALTIDEEKATMDLAERRTGVSPPQQGYGAGVMHGRRGVYTAMGTLSMMQEGNDRTDVKISDLRYAHMKVGRLLALEEATFGPGPWVDEFGDDAELIRQGLSAMASGRMGLPLYAATSSTNREVEKQNDIMLSGLMQRHYQTMATFLQAAANPMLPANVRKYLEDVIVASNDLMVVTLRHFGHDEPKRLVPGAQNVEELTPEQQRASALPFLIGGGEQGTGMAGGGKG